MKVGDLVQWYTESTYPDRDEVTIDYGLVIELDVSHQPPGDAKGAFIRWFSNDGNGWFDVSHPAIGVISASR